MPDCRLPRGGADRNPYQFKGSAWVVVASHAEARIETCGNGHLGCITKVASYAEARIETKHDQIA